MLLNIKAINMENSLLVVRLKTLHLIYLDQFSTAIPSMHEKSK